MYVTLFGDNNSNNISCYPSTNSNRPLTEVVSNLEYTTKEQTKIIEALMDHMSVHAEWNHSVLGEGKIIIKKNK